MMSAPIFVRRMISNSAVGALCTGVALCTVIAGDSLAASQPAKRRMAPAAPAGYTETSSDAALLAPPAPEELRPANKHVVEEPVADVIPPSTKRVVSLPMALSLAEAQNPRIGLARERICEAVANQDAAKALWLPTLNAGTNYHLHAGVLQTSFGDIRTLNEQSIYVGGGARTLAAETVAIPAARIFTHLGDAYYAPLAAAQLVCAANFDAQGVHNLTLVTVATRYLDLLAAEAQLEAIRVSLSELRQVDAATKAFASTGQGRDADYRRAHAELLLMTLEEQQVQEEAGVAAAELSRLLHLDPSVQLTTPAGPIEVIELVALGQSVESLVTRAIHLRPEVSALSSQVGAAEDRVRLEQTRPFLPLLSVGASAGGFGGGSNRQDLGVPSFFERFGGRTDVDVMAVWTLQNLGHGNDALQHRACAERDGAIRSRSLLMANIRSDVTRLHARAVASQAAMGIAWDQLSTAQRGASEDLARTRGGEGLPIETLNSLTRLARSRRDMISAVIDYNRAQLDLYGALGGVPNG